MEQFKIFLQRLKNPTVITSLVSQIIAILVVFNVNVDVSATTQVVGAVASLLVTLGILSNPDNEKKRYIDDIELCESCGRKTLHVKVGNDLVCKNCGAKKKVKEKVKRKN